MIRSLPPLLLALVATAALADRDGYVFLDHEQLSSFGASLPRARLEALRAEGPALVCLRGGKEQVVRNPALLGKARAALAPLTRLGEEQAALGQEQARLGKRQAGLGAMQAELGGDQGRRGARQARLAAGSGRPDESRAEEQAELAEDQGQLQEAQSTLGAEQTKLGAEQSRLGRRQSELGRRQTEAAKEARRTLAALCAEPSKS